MALTRDFRETVQADAKRDPAFRRGLLSDALESLLSGEVPLGKGLLRDYINATVGFPKLAARTRIHVKNASPDVWPQRESHRQQSVRDRCLFAAREGVRFELRCARPASRTKHRSTSRARRRSASAALRH